MPHLLGLQVFVVVFPTSEIDLPYLNLFPPERWHQLYRYQVDLERRQPHRGEVYVILKLQYRILGR